MSSYALSSLFYTSEKPPFPSLVRHLSVDPTKILVHEIIISAFLATFYRCKSCVDTSKKVGETTHIMSEVQFGRGS